MDWDEIWSDLKETYEGARVFVAKDLFRDNPELSLADSGRIEQTFVKAYATSVCFVHIMPTENPSTQPGPKHTTDISAVCEFPEVAARNAESAVAQNIGAYEARIDAVNPLKESIRAEEFNHRIQTRDNTMLSDEHYFIRPGTEVMTEESRQRLAEILQEHGFKNIADLVTQFPDDSMLPEPRRYWKGTAIEQQSRRIVGENENPELGNSTPRPGATPPEP